MQNKQKSVDKPAKGRVERAKQKAVQYVLPLRREENYRLLVTVCFARLK